MKKRDGKDEREKVIDKFSLPPETFSSPRVTLTEGRLYIEGHTGVEEYGNELITVRSRNKLISVRGIRLKLGAMNREELLVTGVIHSVELSDRGHRG